MTYDPKLHHRKSIRLKDYDYSLSGAYFITICTYDHKCFFGRIVNDEMILSPKGKIAYDKWVKLSERFSNFKLDVFQIMPNHIHAIIILEDSNNIQNISKSSVCDIVRVYKSLVTKECLITYKQKRAGVNPAPTMGKIWQRNYFEHIIRNERSYQSLSDYIINNPVSWKIDKLYKE